MRDTPEYADIGNRELALKNQMKTYKHEVLKEMREKGELDTKVWGRIKSDMESIKVSDVIPREFPTTAASLQYPENGKKIGSLLYMTSSMAIGNKKPSEIDMPSKYFPRPESFTKTFLGGNHTDTGLNTF